MPRQLVVIDRNVANYQSLVDQLGSTYSYLLLDSNSDGVTQLANYVAANPGFDAIHLISHGAPGQLALGNASLSEATLGRYTAQLSRIGSSLDTGGDLLIYGCDVAQGIDGQQLVTDLARLTKLDVAASTNKTGGTGDWVLEAAVGQIEYALPALSYYESLPVSGPTVVWTKKVGGDYSNAAYALATDSTDAQNGVYAAGLTGIRVFSGQSSIGANDAFVQKYSADGAILWTRRFGSENDDGAYALSTVFGGSVYVAGFTKGRTFNGQPTNVEYTGCFITKVNSEGSQDWTRVIGGLYNCRVPDDCIDLRRYPLLIARDVMRGLIEQFCSESVGVSQPC
jgi:hypothetical protein